MQINTFSMHTIKTEVALYICSGDIEKLTRRIGLIERIGTIEDNHVFIDNNIVGEILTVNSENVVFLDNENVFDCILGGINEKEK